MGGEDKEEGMQGQECHLTAEKLLYMLQAKPGSFGKYAVIPGPRERLPIILKHVQNAEKNFQFTSYELHTGDFDGKRVSVGNGGMYAPDSAIMGEVLCAGGTEYIIRTGSAGALQEEIAVGDLVIATGCVRGEGTTPYYVPTGFSTVADHDVTMALINAAKKLGLRYHVGLVWTTDALLRETKDLIQKMKGLRVLAVDMVASSMLTVCQLYGKKAGAIMAISDNVVTGELGFAHPKYFDAEMAMIQVALEAIRNL